MPRQRRGSARSDRPYRAVPRTATGRAGPPLGADRRIGLALLPLRLFLGATFVYAGLDKLLFDPTFLDSAAPTSLLAQLHGFAQTSPLAPLITLIAEPLVLPIGIAVALGEIAAGLGALSGLLPRASAWGGFAISVLLWLTASYAIHPFYLGPDLPYAAAWLTLALVGTGDAFTLRRGLERWAVGLGFGARSTDEMDPSRRHFLEGAVIAAVALATGGLAWLFGEAGRHALSAELATAASGTPAVTPVIGPTATPKGTIGTLASLTQQGGSTTFDVPLAGRTTTDPGLLVLLSDGTVVAYDAVCTHAGCTVGFDPSSDELVCPCHGATFDASNHGAVLGGPTDVPLTEVPIHVDPQTGVITLAASG